MEVPSVPLWGLYKRELKCQGLLEGREHRTWESVLVYLQPARHPYSANVLSN